MKNPSTIVRYLNEKEYEKWEMFVEGNEHGTVFHHYFWYKYIFSGFSGISIRIVAAFKEDRIIGGCLFAYRKKWGLKYFVVPFATPFNGILIRERETQYAAKKEHYRKEVVCNILKFLKREYKYISFLQPPTFKDVRPFVWNGFFAEVKYTYRTDLRNTETLFNEFEPSLRRQIKKGGKSTYVIKDTLDESHVKVCYELVRLSYLKNKHPFRLTWENFHKMVEQNEIRNRIRPYSIWLEGIPVAAIVILLDNKCAYYWLAGGDNEYFSSGLNQFLLWDVLKKLAQEGVRCFDFVGANTEAIARYKSNYNFDLVPYFHLSGIFSGLLRMYFLLKKI